MLVEHYINRLFNNLLNVITAKSIVKFFHRKLKAKSIYEEYKFLQLVLTNINS